jgi:hypothetical protein
MALATQKLTMDVGATFRFLYTWRDDKGFRVDLDGYTARMQIRASRGIMGILLADLPTSTIRLQEDRDAEGGVLGVICVLVPPRMADIPFYAKSGYYDLVLTAPDGTVSRVLEGAIVFNAMTTDMAR